MRDLKLNKQQKGLTLVELMVAMVLSLVLIGGVSQTYLSSKQTYRLTEAQSRIQENGRFALHLLTRDIRMADFWGCLTNASDINNLLTNTAGVYDYSEGLEATNNTGLNGSDTITLKGAFNNGLHVVEPGASGGGIVATAAALKVTDDSGLLENEIILVTDCLAGDIFQVTNDPGTGGAAGKDEVGHNTGGTQVPGNNTQNFSKVYDKDASVYRLESKTYFIQAGASGEPGLHVTKNGITSELVEGVENMQILYGVDTDGDYTPNYYVHAGDAAANMDKVVSVKISLLLHSMENNVTSNNLTVNYNGATSTIANRRLGRVFSSTITIRNRMQ